MRPRVPRGGVARAEEALAGVEDARDEVGERAVEGVRVRAEVLRRRVEERVQEAQVGPRRKS